MARAIEILRKEHVNMSRLLALLEHQLSLFEAAGPADLELVRSIGEYFASFPKTCHHPKEDAIFRAVKKHQPDIARTMADLEHEHEAVEVRLNDFLHAVDNVILDVEMPRHEFAQRARQFVEDERKHMAMEERYFFPLALETLSEADWTRVDAELQSDTDPLFDAIVEDKFRDLRRELLEWGEEAG
jgi:hemerythrin-like domain-containing protein